MEFVERIDNLLKEKNLKRAALCDDLGLTHSAITDWKKRGTIPAGDVCVKIARYLDVDVEYLITGVHKDTNEEKENGEDKTPLFINTLKILQTEINGNFQTAINALKK
ncbi:helix-turn-helix domain-containing protein [uncultured Treponema sp.]|uniref:helix-turn-helix domain-containing protein n=1 Tax=uncultured Treponema sp. TaxID=162155 RepID=UPI0015B7EDF2|nr:helix-turn-helix transcriptional regulator [uncultured Treponema sp.]